MRARCRTAGRWLVLACLLPMPLGGCGLEGDDIEDIIDELDEIDLRIGSRVDTIQVVDPRGATLPPVLVERGDTVIIQEEVIIVDDVRTDIIIEEIPDITLVGFENLTGLDGYYRYLADGVLQGVFVFDGETLLLEYPCLFDIELLSEEYFDPFTGELIDSFDLTGSVFFNPEDFQCGDAFIITFTLDEVFADAEAIDLLP